MGYRGGLMSPRDASQVAPMWPPTPLFRSGARRGCGTRRTIRRRPARPPRHAACVSASAHVRVGHRPVGSRRTRGGGQPTARSHWGRRLARTT